MQIRRALLALALGTALSGCFFSLDGSLVDKKRDAGPRRDAVSESKPAGDRAPEQQTASDAQGSELPRTDASVDQPQPGG